MSLIVPVGHPALWNLLAPLEGMHHLGGKERRSEDQVAGDGLVFR